MVENKKEKKVPNLRFEGFTDDWIKRKLGDFGAIEMCRRIYKNETSIEYQIPFYKISTFGKQADVFITEEQYLDYKEKYNFPNVGDILISAAGTLGKTVRYDGAEAYYQDSNIVWLKLNSKEITNDFLYYVYQTINWDNTEGSTIKRLYNKDIKDKTVAIPSTKEQSNIYNLLFTIDDIITLEHQRREQIRVLKQAFYKHIFEPVEKKYGLYFINPQTEWDVVRLENVINKSFKGTMKVKNLEHGETEYLDTNRLNEGIPKYSNAKPDVDKNDILILWDGSKAGRVYTGFEGVLGSTLKSYTLHEKADSSYVYHYLKSKEERISHSYTTPNIPHVVKDFDSVFKILLPTYNEQRKIGNLLDTCDDLLNRFETKIESYKSIKKTLLSKMFV